MVNKQPWLALITFNYSWFHRKLINTLCNQVIIFMIAKLCPNCWNILGKDNCILVLYGGVVRLYFMLCFGGKDNCMSVMEELSASVPLRTPTARVKLSDKWPPPLISAGAFTLETYLDKYFDIQGMGDHLSPLPLFIPSLGENLPKRMISFSKGLFHTF